MHTSFNYTFEAAAAEISAFLSGEMPADGVQYRARHRTRQERAHDALDDLHHMADGMYYTSDLWRDYWIAQGVITPDVGEKMLAMDKAAHEQARLEIDDFFDNGAYADRGIVIDGGKAVHPEDVPREKVDEEQ